MRLFSSIIIILLGIPVLLAQSQGISGSLGLYVFPSNNQSQEQQEADEMACFKWAKEQTGYDPMQAKEQQ